MKKPSVVQIAALAGVIAGSLFMPLVSLAAENDKDGAPTKTVKGEVVDLMCYLDHGAKGDKHKSCASTCIKNGGPVGLLSGEDLYLVVGEHKPMNEELASKAAQTVSLKGKVVERHGMKMIENAQIVEEK
jgi:hypothetical protein